MTTASLEQSITQYHTKDKAFSQKTEAYNLKRGSFSMYPRLQHKVDSDGEKRLPFNALLARQHRASSSDTPTHNSKNGQASSRAVLPIACHSSASVQLHRRKNSNSTFSGSSEARLLFTGPCSRKHALRLGLRGGGS